MTEFSHGTTFPFMTLIQCRIFYNMQFIWFFMYFIHLVSKLILCVFPVSAVGSVAL
jgi:hypothetical protein